MLLVDAGDALARELPEGPAAKPDLLKAELILTLMGKMGYAAMAVGERDLVLPLEELRKKARAAGLPLLAANLVGKDGKKPFGERRLVTAGGAQVGLFAVTEGGPGFAAHGLRALFPEEEAQKQVDALRKEGATLVIGLLHLPHATASALAAKVRGLDLAVQAHEGRLFVPQAAGQALLVSCSDRGRQLGRATLDLEGEGPLYDASPARTARERLAMLDAAIAQVREQARKEPATKAHAEGMLTYYGTRRSELLARAEARPEPGRRTVDVNMVTLDKTVAEDPAYQPSVEAFLFQHPASH